MIEKNDNGELAWVAGPDGRTHSVSDLEVDMLIFGRDDGHSVSIILPDGNQKIKEVKVLGETAKAVTYVEHFSDDSLSNIVSGLPYRGGANPRGF